MSLIKRNKIAAAAGAAALIVSSSASAAAPNSVDPWLALSAMSASGSASAVAAQSDVGVAARSNAGFSAPPLAALAVILATIAVGLYIALDKAGHGRPSSPA